MFYKIPNLIEGLYFVELETNSVVKSGINDRSLARKIAIKNIQNWTVSNRVAWQCLFQFVDENYNEARHEMRKYYLSIDSLYILELKALEALIEEQTDIEVCDEFDQDSQNVISMYITKYDKVRHYPIHLKVLYARLASLVGTLIELTIYEQQCKSLRTSNSNVVSCETSLDKDLFLKKMKKHCEAINTNMFNPLINRKDIMTYMLLMQVKENEVGRYLDSKPK
jgi:hypothetical protein